jgi:hypothetical protein
MNYDVSGSHDSPMTFYPMPPTPKTDEEIALALQASDPELVSSRARVAPFRNVSGALMPKGTAVRLSTTVNEAIILTDRYRDNRVIGATFDAIGDGEIGLVVLAGPCLALVSSSCSAGNALVTSRTRGQFDDRSSGGSYAQIGRCLETANGAGLRRVLIRPCESY